MMKEIADVEWEEFKTRSRFITAKEWLVMHPTASMWRLAWSIWWRILLMALGTSAIVTFLFFMTKSG